VEDEEGKRERPIERVGHRGIEPRKQARGEREEEESVGASWEAREGTYGTEGSV